MLGGLSAACGADESPTGVAARRVPGAPAAMTAVGGASQSGFAGRALATRPSVRVTDAVGSPVAGVLVSFDPDPGSGTVSARVSQTAADGVADVAWTLGDQVGPQRLRARATALPAVTFEATASIGAASFDIEIRFETPGATSAQLRAFDAAKTRWESVLVGELPDIPVVRSTGFCGAASPLDEVVDDLLILAEITTIDGPGGVLGSAGPCLIRRGSDLPVLGQMKFDSADLAALEAAGALDEVVAHEMGHVLGVGSLWDIFGFVADASRADSSRADPHFLGPSARAAFESVGGAGYTGSSVPVEDTGGPGTRLSHWRETVFDDELMTGFIGRGLNPLSLVTIASLEDMGYIVDRAGAQHYRLPSSAAGASASRTPDTAGKITLEEGVIDQPLMTIDETGAVRPLNRR